MLDGFIIRGTTPEHEFELPYPVEIVDSVRVTYVQPRGISFTKPAEECVISEGKITVALTQEETFSFDARKKAEVEIRIKLNNGKVVRSENSIVLRVIDSHDTEVMA